PPLHRGGNRAEERARGQLVPDLAADARRELQAGPLSVFRLDDVFERLSQTAARQPGRTESGRAGSGCARTEDMKKLLGLSAIGRLAGDLPAWAHHSHNAYEVTKWTEMEGTVTEIHYLLPHSWVYIEVKDAKGGEPAIWALEATGPQGIFRNGVGKDDVK